MKPLVCFTKGGHEDVVSVRGGRRARQLSIMRNPRQDELPTTVLVPVRSIFRAVVSTVVPEAKELDERGWSELEALVETTLQDRPRAMHRQLRLFIRTIQWLPVFRHGKRFTSLSAKQRMQTLFYLQDHGVEVIRCGFWGLRTLALLGYYGRPEGVQATGYAADPRGWEALQ